MDLLTQFDSAVRFLDAVGREQQEGLLPENGRSVSAHFFEANKYVRYAMNNLRNCVAACRRRAAEKGEDLSAEIGSLEGIMAGLRPLAMTMSKAYSEGLGSFAPGEAMPALGRVRDETTSLRDELAALRVRLAGQERESSANDGKP